MCGCSVKTKKLALYIAHFPNFVLKICINLGKNSLICCKTLNKQRFLVFCLVDCKYLCTFATSKVIDTAKLTYWYIHWRGKGCKIVGGRRRRVQPVAGRLAKVNHTYHIAKDTSGACKFSRSKELVILPNRKKENIGLIFVGEGLLKMCLKFENVRRD